MPLRILKIKHHADISQCVFMRLPILSDFTTDTEYKYAPESLKNKTSMTP